MADATLIGERLRALNALEESDLLKEYGQAAHDAIYAELEVTASRHIDDMNEDARLEGLAEGFALATRYIRRFGDDSADRFVGSVEAAEILQISRHSVRDLFRLGYIQGYQLYPGSSVRYKVKDLAAMLQRKPAPWKRPGWSRPKGEVTPEVAE